MGTPAPAHAIGADNPGSLTVTGTLTTPSD
jgi:hypothetical protein